MGSITNQDGSSEMKVLEKISTGRKITDTLNGLPCGRNIIKKRKEEFIIPCCKKYDMEQRSWS